MKVFAVWFTVPWVCFGVEVFTTNFDQEPYLIHTPGCSVPNYMRNEYFTRNSSIAAQKCGPQMVRVERVSYDTVQFQYNYKARAVLNCAHSVCEYSLTPNVWGSDSEEKSKGTVFINGHMVTLKNDTWIRVVCSVQHNTTYQRVCYTDWYSILIKQNKIQKRHKTSNKVSWNVLFLGLDTMSRGRLKYTMPDVFDYFRREGWLDFRAHHKVAYNTLPNLLAMMTGKSYKWMQTNCLPLKSSWCKNMFLFRGYSHSDYVTAYGDDTNLPTLNYYGNSKNHFLDIDHYFRVLEKRRKDKIHCSGTKHASEHLLDQASQFVEAHKNDKFFGLFWSITRTHNLNASLPDPAPFQRSLLQFFKEIIKNVLDNTFVFFIGDHGVNYGHVAESVTQIHYDTKLPMFFMWVPYNFRNLFPHKHKNLRRNQFRLTSHYDVYQTAVHILKLSVENVMLTPQSGCRKCISLMEELSLHRNCEDAGIPDVQYCACHNLKSIKNATEDPTLFTALLDLNKRLFKANKNISLERQCARLHLKKILRKHFYVNRNRTYYVTAGVLSPGDLAFEMTAVVPGADSKPLEILDMKVLSYNNGECSLYGHETLGFCVCKKSANSEIQL